MNDYRFGEYIYEKRKSMGISQDQLATLFNVSMDELLQLKKEVSVPEITKIVITGGPCAGKTTGLSRIQSEFNKLGYTVLFIPETATELISGGISPFTCSSSIEFQKYMFKLQLEKEKIFEQAALNMDVEKVLIVCDRGLMDNKAYLDDVDFNQLINEMGTNEVDLRDYYDAVFHMETAAKGAERFYTTENNSARTETIEEAIELDDKLIAAWTGHPHLRVIDNSSDFEHKMMKLISEIRSFLGEPEPYEIERKFLIEYPDIEWLNNYDSCRKIEIIQTYLTTNDGVEVRVRQRGENGNYTYTQTYKRKVSDVKRIEIEKRISKDDYLKLLMEADINKHPVRKTRYCLMYEGQYFEIDIYPFWNDRAIMEIELQSEADEIHFPDEIKVIKEVTTDENYKNVKLAEI